MSARDVIAKALATSRHRSGDEWADAILSALTSSGYRILGPDEVDPVTVDVVARVIGVPGEQMKSADRFLKPEGVEELATAIRALCATHQGG